MKSTDVPTGQIDEVKYLARTYDGIKKLIAASKTRLKSMKKDAKPEFFDDIKKMESLKDSISRKLKRELKFWPVYTEYLEKVVGCGSFISTNLILMFYYAFDPICECGGLLEKTPGAFICVECGKKAKGGGNLDYAIRYRDFPTVSKWWSYMGRNVIDGKAVRRRKADSNGSPDNLNKWSSRGKAIGYQIAVSFEKESGDHPYRRYYDEVKEKRLRTHPDSSPGHRRNMALNETAKLFLSHFWTVARQLDGKPISRPYAFGVLNHDEAHYIQPLYRENGEWKQWECHYPPIEN